ncbi:hypothetical protein AVEN_26171-1 [Araneus ventricosus]|uniref:Uncharacterized protein n=1 Tax=Araneus ventricosus TaxID=182803 RepID=A0A4Y2EQH8_ARAVE|nr:hypothetical protein AVEN_26171-1 [Araneus ventricosus]
MLLAGWCHMVGGCEEANRSIMDWCADFPTRTERGFGKVESMEKRRSQKIKLCWCPVDWMQANFGNYARMSPPQYLHHPKPFARQPTSSVLRMF